MRKMVSWKLAVLVFGVLIGVMFVMWLAAYQRETTSMIRCLDAPFEMAIDGLGWDENVEIDVASADGVCVGDLLYEGDDICSDSIILTGEHVFDSTGPDVMLEISDCRVVVDSIEYN